MLSFANCKLASAIFRLVGGSYIYTHFFSLPFHLVSSFKQKYLLVVEVHFLHLWGACKSAQQTLSCLIQKNLITGSSSPEGRLGKHDPVAQRAVVSRACHFPPPVHRSNPGGWSMPHNAVLWSAWASTGTPEHLCPTYTQIHAFCFPSLPLEHPSEDSLPITRDFRKSTQVFRVQDMGVLTCQA